MRGWRQLRIISMTVTETVLVISSCMQVRVDVFFVVYLLIRQIETRIFYIMLSVVCVYDGLCEFYLMLL